MSDLFILRRAIIFIYIQMILLSLSPFSYNILKNIRSVCELYVASRTIIIGEFGESIDHFFVFTASCD